MRNLSILAPVVSLVLLASCTTIGQGGIPPDARAKRLADEAARQRQEESKLDAEVPIEDPPREYSGPPLTATTEFPALRDDAPSEKTKVARIALIAGIATGNATSEELLGSEIELDFDGNLVGFEVGFNISDQGEIGLRFFKETGDFDLSVTGGSTSLNVGTGIDYERTHIDAFLRGYTDSETIKGFAQVSLGGGSIDFTQGTASPSTVNLGFGLGIVADFSPDVGMQAMVDFGVAIWDLDTGSGAAAATIEFQQFDVRGIVGFHVRL